MFYQISYDEPGRSSRCRDIADFVHFTLFLQVPEMTLDDLWTHVCVNLDNTGKWSFIWPNDINVLYCTWQIWFFKDFFDSDDLLTPVTPNDPGWIFRPITFVEGIVGYHVYECCEHTMKPGGLDAFWRKYWFLTPLTLNDLWTGQRSLDICALGHWSLWPSFIKIGSSTL